MSGPDEPAGLSSRGRGVAIAAALLSGAGGLVSNRVSGVNWVFYAGVGVAAFALVYLGAEWLWRWATGRVGGGEPAPTVTEQSANSTTLPFLSGFTGRESDVAKIMAQFARDEHAVAVVGRRGVGTSSCMVAAANKMRQQFPHRVFYLDLRPRSGARTAYAALRALARAVDTAPPVLPSRASLARAAARLRDALDDAQTLLVLDNVDSPRQVRPLLPPTSRCRILLAGTPRLTQLAGVAACQIREPGTGEAVRLFAAAAGAGAGDSGRAREYRGPVVGEIVELCGRQPRAVRALGYRAAGHGLIAAELLALLRRALAVPAHQDAVLPDVLRLLTARDVAYRAVSRRARRLLRLMALAGVPVNRAAMAALVGRWHAGRLSSALDELLAGRFVAGQSGQRYAVRPLLAAYARMHLLAGTPRRRRVAAQVRLLRYLARYAERQVASLVGGDAALGRPGRGDRPNAWLSLHDDLMHALVVAAPGAASSGTRRSPMPRALRRWWLRTAMALCGWYAHEDLHTEWEEVCRAVLSAPGAGRHADIAGWAYNELGVLRRRRGDLIGAEAALTLALGWRGRRSTAQAEHNLALVLLANGRPDEAVEHLEMARRRRGHADRAGHALTDLALGAAHLARDRPGEAYGHLAQAANTFRELSDGRGYAAALTNLTLAQWQLGEHLDAAQSWTTALREYERAGDVTGRASALLAAGAVLVSAGPARAGQARALLAEGVRLREAPPSVRGRPPRPRAPDQPGPPPTAGLGRTLLYLGDAAAACGDEAEARDHWRRAAEICLGVGDAAGARAAGERLGTS